MVATKYDKWVRGSTGFNGVTIYFKLIDSSKPFVLKNIYDIVIIKGEKYTIEKIKYSNFMFMVNGNGSSVIGSRSKLDAAIELANSEIKRNGKQYPSPNGVF
jgi:hypothetical protein